MSIVTWTFHEPTTIQNHPQKETPLGKPLDPRQYSLFAAEEILNPKPPIYCYFTSKAWNAQNAGAAGILVTHDDISTSMYFPEEADSYNGENLTIPLALISRSLGDSIKNALYDGEFVRVNLEWTEAVTHQDDQADMNKNSIDDQNEWDVHLTSHFMWHFMYKSILF
ncbi:hypothetical protein R6Q57_004264 [Mikania cordata]